MATPGGWLMNNPTLLIIHDYYGKKHIYIIANIILSSGMQEGLTGFVGWPGKENWLRF
jgi:hypothetical protein